MKQTAERTPHWIHPAALYGRIAAFAGVVTILMVQGNLLGGEQELDHRSVSDTMQADSIPPTAEKTEIPGEVEGRQTTLTLNGNGGPVMCVAFSPDGSRRASTSYDGTVKLRDLLPLTEVDTIHNDQ